MSIVKSKAPAYIPSIIPSSDTDMFQKKGGMGMRMGFGRKPALLNVDVTKGFVEKRFDLSCGKAGEKCVQQILRLLQKARRKKLPIFYSRNYPRFGAEAGRWPDKGTGSSKSTLMRTEEAHTIVPEIAPKPGECVITKSKPSAFFGTQLVSLLNYFPIDTLIVTGLVTSGCVRATVVDAFSYNYRVIVPIECVADRGQVSHEVSLFDMDMKYADVIPLADVLCYLAGLRG